MTKEVKKPDHIEIKDATRELIETAQKCAPLFDKMTEIASRLKRDKPTGIDELGIEMLLVMVNTLQIAFGLSLQDNPDVASEIASQVDPYTKESRSRQLELIELAGKAFFNAQAEKDLSDVKNDREREKIQNQKQRKQKVMTVLLTRMKTLITTDES